MILRDCALPGKIYFDIDCKYRKYKHVEVVRVLHS